jgi:hypothetical protein
MTHNEHAKRVGAITPYAAWHLTFGGVCLNCGYKLSVTEAIAANHTGNQSPYPTENVHEENQAGTKGRGESN